MSEEEFHTPPQSEVGQSEMYAIEEGMIEAIMLDFFNDAGWDIQRILLEEKLELETFIRKVNKRLPARKRAWVGLDLTADNLETVIEENLRRIEENEKEIYARDKERWKKMFYSRLALAVDTESMPTFVRHDDEKQLKMITEVLDELNAQKPDSTFIYKLIVDRTSKYTNADIKRVLRNPPPEDPKVPTGKLKKHCIIS